jgi:hypothetical protein
MPFLSILNTWELGLMSHIACYIKFMQFVVDKKVITKRKPIAEGVQGDEIVVPPPPPPKVVS